jgi:ubiquitin-conjugating enzyme E2 D/E
MVEIENQVESDTTPTFHDPSNSWVILGCILPTTEPYCRRSFRIKMILSYCFPLDPPEVRFLSPIYHPNVGTNGQFSDERLNKNSRWTYTKTLVDVVKNLVQLIDDPPIDYSLSMELARLYTEDRKRFDEIALEYVLKYGCPRT